MKDQTVSSWIGKSTSRRCTRWGDWEYRSSNFTLVFWVDGVEWHELDLDRCMNSAQILDWIFYESDRDRISRKAIGDLVAALQAMTGGVMCRGGEDHPVDLRALVARNGYEIPTVLPCSEASRTVHDR
jgi:hypothetical protein